MRTDVKYRFSIVNFSKSDSLYNCGMKPVRIFRSMQFSSYLIILILLFRCFTRRLRPIVTLWVGRGSATTSAITRTIRSRHAFSSSSQIFPLLSMLNKKQWQHAKTTLVVGSRNNWAFCCIVAHAKCLKNCYEKNKQKCFNSKKWKRRRVPPTHSPSLSPSLTTRIRLVWNMYDIYVQQLVLSP